MEAHRDEQKFGQVGEKDAVVERRVSAVTSQASDEQRTLWQNVKRYRKVVWVTFGLTSAILLYGYDNVVVGTVSGMPAFQYITHRLPSLHASDRTPGETSAYS
jgi:hypothetical protein